MNCFPSFKPKKNKIETNLYVDVASLSYEKLIEIINIEIETEDKKDLNYRKIYLKIKVNSNIIIFNSLFSRKMISKRERKTMKSGQEKMLYRRLLSLRREL